MKTFYTDEDFSQIKAEVFPRDQAEFEFSRRFSHTRYNQQIAEVKLYYKHTWQGWVLVKDSDMTEI